MTTYRIPNPAGRAAPRDARPPARTPRPMTAYRPLSVLVVDDYPDTAESCAMLLAMLGHTARFALTGGEALRLAAADPPDVVLLDIDLADLDGCEVARRLAAGAGGKPPLVVALTGCETDADRARTAGAGCHLHLVKPVPPAVLVGVMERFRLTLARDPSPDPVPFPPGTDAVGAATH